MNLIEKLLCVDKKKATEKATKKIRSKKLAKLTYCATSNRLRENL